ncbi:MAG: methylated-DNA--[protein]-cysteine S-methyltransferase [Candidatus Kapabacteria bacterium]|nr:methylated-DNA--[protein]-cysteine S-methyltransferase [Candidatus Kapabacteria bacterium]
MSDYSPPIVTAHIHTRFGSLLLGSTGSALCLCDWRFRKRREDIDKRVMSFFNTGFSIGEDEIIVRARVEIEEYCNGERLTFTVPVAPAGTEFQQCVWRELQTIPYGSTISYLELSRRLGNERAIRAVASANGANALSLIIPCHRVLGEDGSLTGYAGGLEAKRALLSM